MWINLQFLVVEVRVQVEEQGVTEQVNIRLVHMKVVVTQFIDMMVTFRIRSLVKQ